MVKQKRARFKRIVFGWDFWVSIAALGSSMLLMSPLVSLSFAQSFYSVGITTLAIVFSVYFAALAIIISASDDDFVRFLEEDGLYTEILASFKITLLIVFVSLAYSIVLFCVSAYLQSGGIASHSRNWLAVFIFLFSYSLTAAFQVAKDAITYARFRVRFLNLRDKGQNCSRRPSDGDSPESE